MAEMSFIMEKVGEGKRNVKGNVECTSFVDVSFFCKGVSWECTLAAQQQRQLTLPTTNNDNSVVVA